MYPVLVRKDPGVVLLRLQTIGEKVKAFLRGRSYDRTDSIDISIEKRFPAMEVHKQIFRREEMGITKCLILVNREGLMLCIIAIKTLVMKTITASKIAAKGYRISDIPFHYLSFIKEQFGPLPFYKSYLRDIPQRLFPASMKSTTFNHLRSFRL
jgi:hypothetical protein